jgi:hypothetical protein
MRKDPSYFDAALVIAFFVAIPGGIFAAVGTSSSRAGTEHNTLFILGVILLAISGLFSVYAVTGWATKRALLEHDEIKARPERH